MQCELHCQYWQAGGLAKCLNNSFLCQSQEQGDGLTKRDAAVIAYMPLKKVATDNKRLIRMLLA